MNTPDESSQVVLVTGTSSGIGLALARLLSNTQYRVVLTTRPESISVLEAQFESTDRCTVLELDVTSHESCARAINTIEDLHGGVDILINNAAVSYQSVIEHMSRADELLQFETNYFGPMWLIRRVLPRMRRNYYGRIINLSSVAGMMAMPTMGSYSASKFALEGASEALWYELKPWNIRVTLVQAGFIRSDSYERVRFSEKGHACLEDQASDYYLYYSSMSGFVARLMRRAQATPESTANRILEAMRRHNPPLRVPVTVDAHFFSLLRRILPRRLYHAVLYRFLPGIREWERHAKEIAFKQREGSQH